MSDVSDFDDNEDFVPIPNKRRRVAALQPVRKQRAKASCRATPISARRGSVQGALPPKVSPCQLASTQYHQASADCKGHLRALTVSLPANSRIPLRSLPHGLCASMNVANNTEGNWSSSVPAPESYVPEASSVGDSTPGVAASVFLTHPLPARGEEPTSADPCRRFSEPRKSKLASRRSDSALGSDWRERGIRPAASHTAVLEAVPGVSWLQPAPPQRPVAGVGAPVWVSEATPGGRARSPTVHCCPICGCDLAQVSDTATGRDAHVNACLDSGGTDEGPSARSGDVAAGAMEAPFPSAGFSPEVIAVNTSKCREVRSRSELATEMEVAGANSRGEANGCSDLVEGSTDDGIVGGETGAKSSAVAAIELLESDEDEAVATAEAVPIVVAVGNATRAISDVMEAAAMPWATAPCAAVIGSGGGNRGWTAPRLLTGKGLPDPEVDDKAEHAVDAEAEAEADAISAPADADDGDFWPLATQLPLSEASLPVLHQGCSPSSAQEHARFADRYGGKRSAAPDDGLHVSQAVAQAPAAAARGIVELASAVTLVPVADGGAGRSPLRGLDHPCDDECGEETYACYKGSGTDDSGMRKDDDWQSWPDGREHDWDAAAGFGSEPAPGNRAYEERYDPQPEWFVGNGEAVRCVEELEEAGDERELKLNEDDNNVNDDDDGDPVAAWLYRHGLQRWLSRFQDGEVDEAVVPELNDADLQGLGIDSPRARVAILAAARDFGAAAVPTVVGLPQASCGRIQTASEPDVTFAAPSYPGAAPPIFRHPVGQQQQQQQVSNTLAIQYNAAAGIAPELQHLQKQQQKHREEQQLEQQQQRQQRQQCGQQQGQGPGEQDAKGSAMGPPGAQPVAAAGSAQPFASMFLTKPSGPVRITNFFRAPSATAGSSGTESSPTAAAAGIAASWGRAVQQHALVLPIGQAAPWPQQQQQLARWHPQQRQPHPQQPPRPGAVAGGGAGGGGAPVGRLPRWVPECHTIPGTRIVVDLFGPLSKCISASMSPFRILTHFHADHYKGLTRSFTGGTVLASPVTARLVSERLKLPAARLRTLPMDTEVEVDGASLTLVDANHCPGAAMVVAYPPGGWPPVLHTGDCRLGEHMRSNPALQALVGRRCTLVLDTTYCDPQYEFPSQRAVLDAVLDAVKAESFNKRALFVFGTYTIGKERLFLEVAAAMGQKVYCSKEKAATLAACGLAPQYASLITTNHLEANIHAVPLFKVTLDGLSAILQQYRGRYSAVIGFSPTGWNHTGGPRGGGGGGGSGGGGRGGRGGQGGRGRGGRSSVLSRQQQSATIGRRMARGTTVVYQVPYSEHSSFGELRSFVSWLQPGRIVPSVNADGPAGPKTRRMLQLLQGPDQAEAAEGGGGSATAAGAAHKAQAVRRDIWSFMRGSGTAGGSGSGGGGG
ncbi:hypothetical protein VaNZ11_008764 [Volvox africanus]|uniref:SAM domain-containing protein n=1 Tax=Volvox africanus TaxID=51714 RepID=A0ABQ5S7F2_9CHLO|nr:hypothetical protein VaNZ11_008764 [Volvox africanus]